MEDTTSSSRQRVKANQPAAAHPSPTFYNAMIYNAYGDPVAWFNDCETVAGIERSIANVCKQYKIKPSNVKRWTSKARKFYPGTCLRTGDK